MSGIWASHDLQRLARVALVAVLAVLCLWTVRAFGIQFKVDGLPYGALNPTFGRHP